MKHILIASDLSPEALRPFEPIAHLARAMKAKLTVLHVVQDLVVAPHGSPLAPPVSSLDMSGEIEAAREQLVAACRSLENVPELHCEVLSGIQIPSTINAYADEHGVDLIAISTHGRSGWRHLMLGSVAETVLRHAKVPVISFPREP